MNPSIQPKRTLVIGDIHGCHVALKTLLSKVQPAAEDRVVFLGDYIDRGPASREVIDALLDLRKTTVPVFLRGNHEVMILDARESFLKADIWQSYGGLETLFSYGANYRQDWVSLIPDAHWAFFEGSQPYYETNTHIFVHACLDPELDMDAQPDWLRYWEFFDRLRPHKSGKCVICGHTPQRSGEIKDAGAAICIDTGPGAGGWLTCLDVGSGTYWQANEKGSARDGSLQFRNPAPNK
jgi:serine/threonine protein phosphatase 1